MNIIKSIGFALLAVISTTVVAQSENIFLHRDFWKTSPNVKTIKQKIGEGHNASESNYYGFDGVVYAILEGAPDKTIKYMVEQQGNGVKKITHDGRSYLFWAAYKGNISLMEYLVNEGSQIDLIDDHGNTVMTFAASTGQTNQQLYDFLIKCGASITETNREGANSLLLVMPYIKDFKLIKHFQNKGLDINAVDNNGNGAFNYAALSGNIAIMDILLAKGLKPEGLGTNGSNAIIFASKGTRGKTNGVEVFTYLEEKGVNPKVVMKDGTTPLHLLASKNKDEEVIRYFIEKGADVNSLDEKGNTPLMYAAKSNVAQNVNVLAQKTRDVNLANKQKNTALNFALESNSLEVVQILMSHGAKPNALSAQSLVAGYSATNSKEFSGKMKALEALDFNSGKPHYEGNTLAHYAAAQGNAQLMKMVIGKSIDLNAKNDEGYTALHIAAMKSKDPEVLRILVDAGAQSALTTEFGENAYDLATENELLAGNKSQLEFLIP